MKLSIGAACVAVAVMVALSSFSPVIAQTPEPSPGKKINSLEAGAWALVFDIDTDAILTSYNGAVSVKRHVSPKTAYRAGLSFSSFWMDDVDETSNGTDLERGGDRDLGAVGLYADYLRYTNPDARVNFYWGAGPFGQYSRQDQSLFSSANDTLQEVVYTAWQAGVTGRIGVEWFAAKSLGFHAEYSVKGYYSWRRNEQSVTGSSGSSSSSSTSDGWALNTSAVIVGLSAYF